MNRCLVYLTVSLFLLSIPARAQERCGAAKDLVVQAREKARPSLDRQELEYYRQLLKRANEFCPSMGDAYYYRHLFAKQLGNTKEADYALRKAKENGSEALNYDSDPFSTLAADSKITVSPTVREKWALVVGVSRFRNGIAPLHFPAKDARDFYAWLQDSRFGRFKTENIRLLTDSEATTQKIKEGLNWLARNAQKDDLVVVFVSSHGSPREFDTGGVSYVVTYDTDASNQDSIYATALEMIEIADALSTRIRAQRGVLFLDTCFSGAVLSRSPASAGQALGDAVSNSPTQSSSSVGSKALTTEGTGVSNVSLDRFRYSIGRVVITASRPDERSWESERLKNGFFTYFLIEGLKQNNGKNSIEQLYGYLKDEVSRSVQAEKKVTQSPMMLPAKPNVDIRLGADSQPQ